MHPQIPSDNFSHTARVVFLGALAGVVLSKGSALVPAFSLDDYGVLYRDRDLAFYLGQGRFTQAVIQSCLSALGVAPVAIAWTSTLLFLFFVALALAAGIAFVARGRGQPVALATAAALAAAHPYLTEYFSFRESQITQEASFGLLALFFFQLVRFEQDLRPRLLSVRFAAIVLTLVFLAGAQQTAFVVAILFVVARLLADLASPPEGITLAQALRGNRPPFLALVFGAAGYAAVFLLIRVLNGVPSDQRSSLLATSDLPNRLRQIGELIGKVMIGSEPVLSRGPKILLLATLLCFVLWLSLRNRRAAFLVTLYLGFSIALSVAIVGFSGVWWPVPRAMYGIGFGLGATLVLLTLQLSPRETRVLVPIGALVALAYSFHSSAMLFEQRRLNRWDAWVASAIAKDLLDANVDPNSKIVFVTAPWRHPIDLKTMQGDFNVSALIKRWSAGDLMRESTGIPWQVETTDEAEVCKSGPKWPRPGSIRVERDASYVCFERR